MARVLEVVDEVRPDAVVTFGPLGISKHEDHIAMSQAVTQAFHRHVGSAGSSARVFYMAIPENFISATEGMDLFGMEAAPTTFIDIKEHHALKIQALRTYKSQEDAQWVAGMFEERKIVIEYFHQAYPPLSNGVTTSGFW